MTGKCDHCGENLGKHQDSDYSIYCLRALKKDRKARGAVMWIALIGIVVQAAFYNLYAIPTLGREINDYVWYIEYLEQETEEYELLAPELNSENYNLRMKTQ